MSQFTSSFTGNQIESRLANYGICSAAAGDNLKSVTLSAINNSRIPFELFEGVTVRVKFLNSNTAENPILDVNSTGGIPIFLYGNEVVGTTEATSWLPGAVVSFTYDGQNWIVNDYRLGAKEAPKEPVTTDYEYFYDGDTSDSNTNSWVYNYGGTKVFAKMGDIPEGELNLVGSTLFRTNPSNEWLNRSFTITEEHLTKVLNKAETDIPATQDGLIQIYDTMASDFSEFTVLAICTKPGWYNVCFDDWYEIIQFTETGIFAYDKRPYGGNDYLKSFAFSATVYPYVPDSGNSGGTTPSVNTSPVNYTGSEIQMFHRGICIGDSVTEGSFDNDENGIIVKEYSYPSILERLTNIDIVNAGIAGATSQTWYEASLNSDSLWGKWVNQGWVWNMNPAVTVSDTISSVLDYSGFDFAVIHLGINDLGLTYGETPLDEVLANFELYIGNIITKLKEANSGIKIFLATIIPSYAVLGNQSYVSLNDKIKAIVEATADTYLIDLNKYSEIATDPAYNRVHPTALGYQKLAAEVKALISYVIKNNLDEFKTVQFTQVGTVSGFSIQKLTQESYDALGYKDPNTLYIIV